MKDRQYEVVLNFLEKAEEFLQIAEDELVEFKDCETDGLLALQVGSIKGRLKEQIVRVKCQQRMVALRESSVASTS